MIRFTSSPVSLWLHARAPIGFPIDDVDETGIGHGSAERLAEARILPLTNTIGQEVRGIVQFLRPTGGFLPFTVRDRWSLISFEILLRSCELIVCVLS